jgi:hypothetical protein
VNNAQQSVGRDQVNVPLQRQPLPLSSLAKYHQCSVVVSSMPLSPILSSSLVALARVPKILLGAEEEHMQAVEVE